MKRFLSALHIYTRAASVRYHMKKNIVWICIACLSLTGCAASKDKLYSEVETAYQQLREKSNLSYEVTFSFDDGEIMSQRYVIEKNNEEWQYRMYFGEDMFHECKYENGKHYFRYSEQDDDTWLEQDTNPPMEELTFLDSLLAGMDDIDTVSLEKNDSGIVAISMMLTDEALETQEAAMKRAGEDAITKLEDNGAFDVAIEAQRQHNQTLESTTLLTDERTYLIDENGVLTGYTRTVVSKEPDTEGNLAEITYVYTISVSQYQF